MFQGKGQTVLHFAKSYTFDDLFVLLKGKVVAISFFLSCPFFHTFAQGADDAIKNSDGLTCYEGLIDLSFVFFKTYLVTAFAGLLTCKNVVCG